MTEPRQPGPPHSNCCHAPLRQEPCPPGYQLLVCSRCGNRTPGAHHPGEDCPPEHPTLRQLLEAP